MSPSAIEASDAIEAELDSFLDERIYEYNIQETGFDDGRPFSGVIRDEARNVVAAGNGHTGGGCCHVADLWVKESLRRRGHRARPDTRSTHDPTEASLEPAKTRLAVLNNIRWYEAMFDAHDLAHETDGSVWLSQAHPPAFHSNLVVRSPAVSQTELQAYAAGLEKEPRPPGWSLKDSFARFDLTTCGFAQLFEAQWIWRDPGKPRADAPSAELEWMRVSTATELQAWEAAWWGDLPNASAGRVNRQFPDGLLSSHEHLFLAGKLDGRVVAGGIANGSPGVVGISNLFSPAPFAQEAWDAIAAHVAAAFPNTPLVGYERGADLERACRAGFEPVGSLRVWCRTPGSNGAAHDGRSDT